MNIKKWGLFLGLASAYSVATAGAMGMAVAAEAIGIPDTCTSIIALTGGPVIYQNDHHNTLIMAPVNMPIVVNHYVDSPLTRVLGTAELFFGLGQPLLRQLGGELGLILGYGGEGVFNGKIYQNASGFTNNLTYKYKITNVHIGFKGKLIADLGYGVNPYITASAGAGFNHSYNYLANGANLGFIPPLQFNNNTELAFTYAAGFGAQAPVSANWQVGLGYEFDDWGKNSLNITSRKKHTLPVSGNTIPQEFFNNTYHRSHFFAHQIQFSLIYTI